MSTGITGTNITMEPFQKNETIIKRPGAFSYNLLHITLLKMAMYRLFPTSVIETPC